MAACVAWWDISFFSHTPPKSRRCEAVQQLCACFWVVQCWWAPSVFFPRFGGLGCGRVPGRSAGRSVGGSVGRSVFRFFLRAFVAFGGGLLLLCLPTFSASITSRIVFAAHPKPAP